MTENEQEAASVEYIGEVDEAKSPLAQALQAHFKRHYLPNGKPNPEPFGSRNRVAPPLNYDLINSADVLEQSQSDASEKREV